MDQFRKEGGGNNIRGSPSERKMQQNQQNPGARPNAPGHAPPPPPAPQQGHKCPRCESTNTKFCYYNNYSLTQPRYFCKGCRRYWTQGGTLRSVPVGGGCRKGSKRAKTSTSATTSTEAVSSRSQPPPGTVAPPIMNSNTSYYPGGGGGFLSSLAAIQSSIGQPQLDLGGPGGSSGMNIGFLQGLGILPPLSSQAHLFRGPPPPPPSSSSNEWIQTQGFIGNLGSNNDINPSNNIGASVNSTAFWSPNSMGGTTSSTGVNEDNAGEGSSLNPNQWLGLPGYGPPQ